MKNINKVIHHKIIEITISLLIIVVSFPIWEMFMGSDNFSITSSLANSSMVYTDINNYQNYDFYPMKDEIALNFLVPMKVNLKNDTLYNNFYTLVLKLDKKSTLSYEVVKTSLDNEIFFLRDLYLKEDNDFIYFLLKKGDLEDVNQIYVSLWMDENFKTDDNETFIYKIINLENTFTL